MKPFAIVACLASLAACYGTVEDFPPMPADAASVTQPDAGSRPVIPVVTPDAGQPDPVCAAGEMLNVADVCVVPCHRDGDCGSDDLQCGPPLIKGDDTLATCQPKPEPLPICLPDPFVPVGPGEFKLATWLAKGTPCAHISGLPSTGNAADDAIVDVDYSGDGTSYYTVKRDIPPGIYHIGLAPMDCRTHQFGEDVIYDEKTLGMVRGDDRLAFYCIPVPEINCIDWGNGNYQCWVEKTFFMCNLRIEVLADGTVKGAGGMWGSVAIEQKCE